MSLARRVAALLGLALAPFPGAACNTTLEGDARDPPDPGGSGGGGTPGSTATAITFVDAELVLVPADLRSVDIVVVPPAVHRVRFTVLGDSKDAFVDRGQLDTAPDGTATVRLRAPSTPSTFRVRASVGDLYAEIQATQSRDETAVDVKPRYTGRRNVGSWVATIRTGTDCTATPGEPPPDGPLRGESAAAGPARVSGVPLGTPLTVILRSEHFAWGCVELAEGFEGVLDRAPEVTVSVTDRALRLEGARLPLRLGIETVEEVISAWNELSVQATRAALTPGTPDSRLLLDAMGRATPSSGRAAFEAARAQAGWDDQAVAALLRDGSDDRVRAAIAGRMRSGLTLLARLGLTGTLSTGDELGTEGTLKLATLGGLPATVAASTQIALTLTAEPLDRLLFGGTATIEPWKLAAALGEAETLAQTGFDSIAHALSIDVGCEGLAAALVDTQTGFAYPGCDAACLSARCELALGALWQEAADGDVDPALVEITASGDVSRIDGAARPLAFEGVWVGSTTLSGQPTRLGGSATAEGVPGTTR